MTAEILSVGTELLMGQILNSNAQYIAGRLTEIGVNVYRQLTVGDNHGRLFNAVEECLAHADVVIMTGGLGPTGDDISKETVAEVLGCTEFELDEQAWAIIVNRFKRLNTEPTPNNRKQAMFPKGCKVLPNPHGTAPGCIIEKGGKAVVLLPGPPREMQPMFDNHVMPYLAERSNTQLYSRIVRVFGAGESTVEYELKDLMKMDNPTVAPYAQQGEMMLRVTARCKNQQEGERMVAPVVERIKQQIGNVVYDTNGRTLGQTVADLLITKGATLAAAESCTGGMLASMLTDVPGSSKFFLESVVTYSNEAKKHRLGVEHRLLDEHTAVSPQVACAMAEGVRQGAGADFGIATTGYAGPDGGTKERPIGTVFIALADSSGTQVEELHLTGGRDRVRHSACLNALDMIRRRFML